MTFVIALLFMGIGAFAIASEQQTCSEGSHYEGEYVETESCNRICTFSFFGHCMRYENRCTTSGSWIGSCVVNPVEEEPVDEDPIDEDGDDEEEVAPAPVVTYSDHLWAILANQCKEEFIEYSPWSECLNGFNVQIRTAKPLNGCHLTGLQQAHLIKRCNALELGLGAGF